MRRAVLGLLLGVVGLGAGCSGGNGGGDGNDRKSSLNESCVLTDDCESGLVCIALTCTPARSDAGAPDARRPGHVGDSCLRTEDCAEPLRCVSRLCVEAPDGGVQDSGPRDGGLDAGYADAAERPDGAIRDAAMPDGGVRDASAADGSDAGQSVDGSTLPLRAGCDEPGPVPRGTGGCCTSAAECISGLCIQGMCSALCTGDSHCAITAPATPFPSTVTLRCGDHPTGTGRACLPGSLEDCTEAECPPGESCNLAWSQGLSGNLLAALRCTADRVASGDVGDACRSSSDCRAFEAIASQCRQGVCRAHCDAEGSCESPDEVCVAAQTSVPTAAGYCEGAMCGSPPTGSDRQCLDGHVCVPSLESQSTDGWAPRCAPPAPAAIPDGNACEAATASSCAHRMCVSGTCSRLCAWDADCPAGVPFCSTRPASLSSTATAVVTACINPPNEAQLCRSEADCGLLGCHFLDGRSYFSSCRLSGTSVPADEPCASDRSCPTGRVCLPDADSGTLRCTERLHVGSRCTAADRCRSGSCVDRDGMAPSPGSNRPTFCSSRCQTAADCGAGMECRSVVTASVTTAGGEVNVLHPLCWPLTPALSPCSASLGCLTALTGTTCDTGTGACHTPEAVVGSACSVDAECALGLRCGSATGEAGICVREGCIPGVSGGGCDEASEVCIPTGPITAECRPLCDGDGNCRTLNVELTCSPVDGDTPRYCRK